MFTVPEFDQFSVKVIWWYIAEVDAGARETPLLGEFGFRAEWFACEEALGKLTFKTDREVLRKAIELVDGQQSGYNCLPN
jgi:hypothetical protein